MPAGSASTPWPSEWVQVDRNGAVLTVALNRPAKYNAFNTAMVTSVSEVFRLAETDPEVRAIVLTGRGRHFAVGADITEYAKDDSDAFRAFTDLANEMCERISTSPHAVVAAVNGLALGGGFEVVLSCDLVVAAQDASFGLPELRLGLIPGWGGTQRLPALVGANRARAIILLGERIDAEQARAIGLVHRVCSADALLDHAHQVAAALAEQPAMAVAAAKRAVAASHAAQPYQAMGHTTERDELLRLFATADAREGIAAFVGKRTPRFQHR